MTRQGYITGLEAIRSRAIELGEAYGSIKLKDAIDIEHDRALKTAKLIRDLCNRLYEDIAISTKVMVDNAANGEQGDLFEENR